MIMKFKYIYERELSLKGHSIFKLDYPFKDIYIERSIHPQFQQAQVC